MKKQYIIQKVVMAESVEEAIRKARKIPISEVFIHNSWLDKEKNFNMFDTPPGKMGYKEKK